MAAIDVNHKYDMLLFVCMLMFLHTTLRHFTPLQYMYEGTFVSVYYFSLSKSYYILRRYE